MALPYDTAHPLAHNVGTTWFSPVSYLKWTGVVFWLLNPGTVVSRAGLPVLPVLYLFLALALSKGRAFDRLPPTLLRAVRGVLIAVACTQTIRSGSTRTPWTVFFPADPHDPDRDL